MSIFGKKKNESTKAAVPEKAVMQKETEEKEAGIISDEILAAIAAAIASMEARPGYRLQVQAIRRIHHSSPVWNTTGRTERLGRHLNA